jgi:hypothetical protein
LQAGAGGDLLLKMIGMQKTAEGLPILKAYGIDIERQDEKPEE